jgi:flagellar biosynthesis protein FliQ
LAVRIFPRNMVGGEGKTSRMRSITRVQGQTLWVAIVVAGPPLLLVLVIGLIISIIQTGTSVNEPTVSFIPKILALVLFLALYGAVAVDVLVDFTRDLWTHIPEDVR